jgi:hypothetical protein
MKLQQRDMGWLITGFIAALVLVVFLPKNRAQPPARLSVPITPPEQVHLHNEEEATGSSIVSPELRQRAVRKILEIDVSKSGGCMETRKIKPKPVSFMPPGVLTERWSVQRCGATVFYNVQFVPTPHGEMEITVSAEN